MSDRELKALQAITKDDSPETRRLAIAGGLLEAAITEEMIDRAAAAYVFGVMPGDESEATEQEIRQMAERVLRAALSLSGDDQDRF